MQRAIIGKPAPIIHHLEGVFEEDFVDVSLEEFRGKYVVLMFFVRDFTKVCESEVLAFSRAHDDFVNNNCQVLAISTDSKYTHLSWTGTGPGHNSSIGPLKMPLLSDHSHMISRQYGILHPDGHSQRATFIIDSFGVLRQASFYDPGIDRSVTETLRLLRALQSADKENASSAG